MRTLAITQNITVDGSIELLDDWFDPTDQDEELAVEIRRQSAEEDILLLGRRTFLELRAFWPEQATDETGIAAHLDRVAKYVVSSTLTDPGWVNSIVLGIDWLNRVRATAPSASRTPAATSAASPAASRSAPHWWPPASWTSTASSCTRWCRPAAEASSRTTAMHCDWRCAAAAASRAASSC